MKKYLCFVYDRHYPCGGFNDFIGEADSIEEAKKMCIYDDDNLEVQIIDIENNYDEVCCCNAIDLRG